MTYILFNPHANNGNGAEGAELVKAALADRSPELCDLTAIDVKAFLEGLTAEDRVILCGGDGTLNRLVNDLDGVCPDVPIHVWRFGTGNDFLRDVAGDGPDAQTVLLNGYIKNLPCVELGGERRYFLNGCGAGVDALVCKRMNEDRGKKPSYIATAIRSFFKDFKTTTARVTVDGETRTYDRVWMAGALNGRYQGGGMLFAPDQDRRSDKLCCFVWHGTGPLGTLLCFPSIMKGKHTRYTKYCDIRFGREITVELGDAHFVQFDGETVSDITRLTIRKQGDVHDR